MKRRTFLKNAIYIAALGEAFIMNMKQALATESLGPLLETWTGDHNGYPRFDLAKTVDLKAAMMKGMDLKREEIKKLVAQSDKANVENTLVPLEDASSPLNNSIRFCDI